jgi:type IV pilus assembly protein PilF
MKFVTLLGSILILAGCVSTTSGPPKPSPDKKDAAELNYQLGARYYSNGKYDLARDRLKLSLEFDDKRAATWSTLALAYEALDNPRLAKEAYEEAVRVDPRSFESQNTYAVFLCRQGDYREAARYFDRAASAEKNDNAEITLTNAGVCMAQKPDLFAAEAFFRRALEEKENHPEALLQLALLKRDTQDFLAARAFIQRFLSRNIPSPGVLFLGYEIESELGDSRAMEDYADRLIREFPSSAEARRVLDATS